VDAIDVPDYSGPPGHSLAAVSRRQGRAPGVHDSYSLAHRCSDPKSAICSSSSSSGCCRASHSMKTPATLLWSVHLSAQAGHTRLLNLGRRTCQRSATSATTVCCYHCCRGYFHDCSSSSGSYTVANVRVSTSSSSSLYYRSWI
jgi:hypothetical protein